MRRAALGMIALAASAGAQAPVSERARDERLVFQTAQGWSERVNLNADVAIVYGIGPALAPKIDSWRKRGYGIHVMTGVAWGEYQDYLDGKWDGTDHWDQAQKRSDGTLIQHGPRVPYISPGINYGKYLTAGVERALDAGATAIHLEEPEFWAAGGWEENFKREWKDYYHEDWRAPDSSPDAQYRSSKLKYFLYRRALAQIFDFARDYAKKNSRAVRCYVPTHSLINYAHWRIVSPESSLLDVGADGYIAQVWTGTSRTPNVYQGVRKERTFETAFLEYGAMQNLVRASGRRVWYLNDPIEDNPNHTWEDYRTNWESTLTASLLQPEVWHYEIMPWPDRIFKGKYPSADGSKERIPMPKAYETELQSVIRALGEMKQADTRWVHAGTAGIGVLISDTMMFQRAAPNPSDENLGSFYGLAMPLVKRGIPVEPVQLESIVDRGFLDRYKVLLLTYEGQKPPSPKLHDALAAWVRAGGALVVVDDDRDPYNAVREWWNTAPMSYGSPREHLFELLQLDRAAVGLHKVGQGIVLREAASPAGLSYAAGGGDSVRRLVRQAAAAVGLTWSESAALVLERGPYVIAAGLDEVGAEGRPVKLSGKFIDLFDAALGVRDGVTLEPGKRVLLRRVTGQSGVVAAGCRIRDEQVDARGVRFTAEGIGATAGVVRVALPASPVEVLVDGKKADVVWDSGSRTVLVRFSNTVEGVRVEVRR